MSDSDDESSSSSSSEEEEKEVKKKNGKQDLWTQEKNSRNDFPVLRVD